MDKTIFFDPARQVLGLSEWKKLLEQLKQELAVFLDCSIDTTKFFYTEEDPSFANFACSVDVLVHLFPEANLQYGGVICYSKNYEKSVYVDVFLLAFVNGKRLESNSKAYKYLTINYTIEQGWNNPRWLQDEWEEWVSYKDTSRWKPMISPK